MLNIKNVAALAAVLAQIDAAIAQGAAYAQCKCSKNSRWRPGKDSNYFRWWERLEGCYDLCFGIYLHLFEVSLATLCLYWNYTNKPYSDCKLQKQLFHLTNY